MWFETGPNGARLLHSCIVNFISHHHALLCFQPLFTAFSISHNPENGECNVSVSTGPDSARTGVKRPFCSNFMPVIPAPAGSAMSSSKLVHKLVRQTSADRRPRRNANPNPACLVILRGPVLSMLVTVLTTLVGCVAGKFVAYRGTSSVSHDGKNMHNCGPSPRLEIIVGSWPIKLT